jgi:hypothetical protein
LLAGETDFLNIFIFCDIAPCGSYVKRHYSETSVHIHGAISQKMEISVITAVKISNPIRNVHFSIESRAAAGYHTASYVTDVGVVYSRADSSEREVDHSPPRSTEVTNDGATPPVPHTFSGHSC